MEQFINDQWENALPTLSKYIEIPNQSPGFDANWKTNGLFERVMKLLSEWVLDQKVPNLKLEVIQHEGKTPLLFLEIPATEGNKNNKTVLMYGHADKQPPMEPWSEGLHPYKPVLKDGKLYGRGSADDGYSTFAAIMAIKAIESLGKSHSRIVVTIECAEESGSPDLDYYINALLTRIGDIGLVFCLDSGAGNYEQFWMTNSLRGIASGVLKVKILNQAVHSGSGSGVIPSSFRIQRILLDRIEDSKTGKVKLKELESPLLKADVKKQIKQCASVLGDTIWNEFPLVEGSKPMNEDNVVLLTNKTWKPALSVTGAEGFPAIINSGNVVRTNTDLKLSMRIPPGVVATEAQKLLKETLEKDPPYGAKVEFALDHPADPWAAPKLASWLDKSVQEASNQFFAKPALYIGEGGSIPFMALLGRLFPQAQFVVTGVLGPQSNAHGPDEFLHIPMVKKVTCCVAKILGDFSQFDPSAQPVTPPKKTPQKRKRQQEADDDE